MNSEWRDMAAYVARLERERDELRVALQAISEHCSIVGGSMAQYSVTAAIARRALSSGERTEGGR